MSTPAWSIGPGFTIGPGFSLTAITLQIFSMVTDSNDQLITQSGDALVTQPTYIA